MFNNSFSKKSICFSGNSKNNGTAKQATEDNMMLAERRDLCAG
jgi:hypothetical protein